MARRFQFRLDLRSGVPVYRQLVDQVLVAISSAVLQPGDQLPTVRQLAVDLSINPNTVARAYRELEIRGFLTTQQGSGTFVTPRPVPQADLQRQKRLSLLVSEFVAHASAEGYDLREILDQLKELADESGVKRS